jgi:hypothetical protein
VLAAALAGSTGVDGDPPSVRRKAVTAIVSDVWRVMSNSLV